jgi:aminopeptidase N
MWIHEAWTTYLEVLYVERQYGRADAIKYTSGFVPKVFNRRPVLAERGVNQDPDRDQYFKGALMIATLRSIIGDDPRWFTLLHAFYQHFKYQNILTEDVVTWWNKQLGQDLTPFFNQYLRHTVVPCLELNFDEVSHTVMYKWQADEPGFSSRSRWAIPPTGRRSTRRSTGRFFRQT